MSELSRELKKNELEDFVVLIAEWIKHNQSIFFSVAGIIIGFIIFGIFFFSQFYTLNNRASEKLAFGQSMLYQGQAEQGSKLIDEVINQYTKTPAALQAILIKADYLMSLKKNDEAEKLLLTAADKEKPKEIIPLILSSLGSVQENEGKYQQALGTYNSFLTRFPDNYIAPKIYESLGRVYELINSPVEAKAIYEKMVLLYPSTPWATKAQERAMLLTNKI